jgi:hypothetical protein
LLVLGLALVFAGGGWGPALAAPAGQTAPYLTAFDLVGSVRTPKGHTLADQLHFYISVQGSDGYEAIVVSGEFDPNFANKSILVSFEEDGRPLTGGGGFARLVVPGDRRGGR